MGELGRIPDRFSVNATRIPLLARRLRGKMRTCPELIPSAHSRRFPRSMLKCPLEHRHKAKGALKGAEDDALLLDSLATMGLSFDGRAKKGRGDLAKSRGDTRLRRRNSWDSVMTSSLDSDPASFDKVAKETGELLMAMEAGELLMAMYGGASGRALGSFDVSAIDQHSMRHLATAAIEHFERVGTTRSNRRHGPRFSGTDYRSFAPPQRRTAATPRRPVGSGAVLEAVPEGSVLVTLVPPGRCDGCGARHGARWRWLFARAASRT